MLRTKILEQMKEISLKVNGKIYSAEVPVRFTLADFLREELCLTGTHIGCEHGFCGSCTILVDGISVRSCLMLAVQANGCSITTIEGLSNDYQLNTLQQSFQEHHGLQCGFCTPGFLMTATELLNSETNITEEKVKEAISGNICRCTGYKGIVNAIMDAGQKCSQCKHS